MRCAKNRSNGQPCQAQAVTGTDACRVHAGRPLDQHKAKGAVVMELRSWGLTDKLVDSKTAMLRLMSQSFRRAAMYSEELEEFVADHGGDIHAALVSDTEMPDGAGGSVKVGEYLVGMQRMEAEERDRAFRFAERAVAAGLDERLVKVAEQQGALIAEVLRGALLDLAQMLAAGTITTVDPSDPNVLRVVGTRLRALSAGDVA